MKGARYVFPGATPGVHLADRTRVREAVGPTAGLSDLLHDRRHSHASVAVSGGLSLPVIGQLIGHKEAATTQRCAHFAADPLRRAADNVSTRIAAAIAAQL